MKENQDQKATQPGQVAAQLTVMTVQQVEVMAKTLVESMTRALQDFESVTGCIVHSLPVLHFEDKRPTEVRIKTQIPS